MATRIYRFRRGWRAGMKVVTRLDRRGFVRRKLRPGWWVGYYYVTEERCIGPIPLAVKMKRKHRRW